MVLAKLDANQVVATVSPCDKKRSRFSVPLWGSQKAINQLDFSMIFHKICMPSEHQWVVWEKEAALEAVGVYRNWLWIIRKYGAEYPALPPSIEIDEIWHYHILDTRKYQKDCQAIFGCFLDHYPYFGIDDKSTMEDLSNAFETTKLLYRQEFGCELPSLLIQENR